MIPCCVQLGMKQDVNIFNILLRVYTFNEFKVVPSEFLERMKESGVSPNLVHCTWHICSIRQSSLA